MSTRRLRRVPEARVRWLRATRRWRGLAAPAPRIAPRGSNALRRRSYTHCAGGTKARAARPHHRLPQKAGRHDQVSLAFSSSPASRFSSTSWAPVPAGDGPLSSATAPLRCGTPPSRRRPAASCRRWPSVTRRRSTRPFIARPAKPPQSARSSSTSLRRRNAGLNGGSNRANLGCPVAASPAAATAAAQFLQVLAVAILGPAPR